MLSNPTAGRRLTGRAIVLAGIAVALPLTASRAIEYIDVPAAAPAAPAPVAAVPTVAAVPAVRSVPAAAQVAAVAPAAPVAPGHRSTVSISDRMVTIDGQTKEWKDLSPAEKAQVRRSLALAREEVRRVNREAIQRDVREALRESRINREEFRREMAEARAEIDQAMREVDAHSAELRRSGQDPEQLKATIRSSLKAVQAIDVEAITRQAMASANPAAIEAALAGAEAGLDKAEAEIERLEALDESED